MLRILRGLGRGKVRGGLKRSERWGEEKGVVEGEREGSGKNVPCYKVKLLDQ